MDIMVSIQQFNDRHYLASDTVGNAPYVYNTTNKVQYLHLLIQLSHLFNPKPRTLTGKTTHPSPTRKQAPQ